MSAHIDFETRSTVDLRKTGADKYAAHEDTDVWCMAYSLGAEDAVKLWHPRLKPPVDLFKHIAEGELVYAHNAPFELAIWNNLMTYKYAWPELPIAQTQCTMAMCYALALPPSLENAAKAVGLPLEKDIEGRRLMLQMARPRRIEDDGAVVWWDDEARLLRLREYCKVDVNVERALEKRLLRLTATEQSIWRLDRKINNTGVRIDMDAVTQAISLVDIAKNCMNVEIKEMTGGSVGTANQVAKIKAWCEGKGVVVDTLSKPGVAELLAGELPDDVRRVLELRASYAKSSTAKLNAMAASAGEGDRARGLFQYHGAGTGRWAGRRIQLQNMPRPQLPQKDIDWVLDNLHDPELITLLYGSPLRVISDCLRGLLSAAPGNEYVCADFSSIEARITPWLAGENGPLEVFRTGGDIYLHAASSIYKRDITTKDKDERQIGKVATLALGFGGGVGAFQALAQGYGVSITDEDAENIKTSWREAHPHIVRYWRDLEYAAKNAIENRGTVCRAGHAGRECKFTVLGSFLFCKLPSGRCLSYPYPGLEDVGFYRDVEGKVRGCSVAQVPAYAAEGLDSWTGTSITYKGMNLSNQWTTLKTYGGKLCENVTQAVARDLLAEAMLRLDEKDWNIVMHVHDEVVCEAPIGTRTVEDLENIMAEVPPWANGLPLNAEGWCGKRYRK